ncbi:MAG: bifunctional DNA-binding transcriptional regulator/O6-methylguanine-DNA methyltransferase Ada [Rhodospirillales bacterium]
MDVQAPKTETAETAEAAVRWPRVLARDVSADGEFVYAVRSTGIYCRPSCPSRRPRDAGRVRFFDAPEAAEHAGFRACKRCRPACAAVSPALAAVRRVCAAVDAAEGAPPPLDDLARIAGLSPHYLQRAFKRMMGVSPKAYADARRLARFKQGVKGGEDVTQAMYGAGYGSSSRLYERAAETLGMTPASYARGGRGAHIRYAVRPCALGLMLTAATETGVAMIGFGDSEDALEAELRGDFSAAEIIRDDAALGPWVDAVLESMGGAAPPPDLPLDVRATAFQARVWRELMRIPAGETLAYGEIAARIGQPKAARAVGRACGSNPVSIVIPCHRAVGASGALTGYRWGKDRKAKLLAEEAEAAGAGGAGGAKKQRGGKR